MLIKDNILIPFKKESGMLIVWEDIFNSAFFKSIP